MLDGSIAAPDFRRQHNFNGRPTAFSRSRTARETSRKQPGPAIDKTLLRSVYLCRGRAPQGGNTVMFTLITTWIAQRILTVTAVSVVAVAAVPTTLIVTSHHDDGSTTTVAVVQPVDDQQKLVLISAVKKAGDDIIARLNTAQATCDSQLTQTVSSSKVAAKLQPALANARATVGSSVSPIIAAIRSDEDHFDHLRYVSQQDEENELADLDLIEVLALGNGRTGGTVTVTCQTVSITITQTIQITIVQQTAPSACTSKDERDDD